MSQYISFDDTHIVYDSNDPFGLLAVHFSLLPIYLMVFYASWFIITREIEPVVAVGGQLVSEGINKILKRIFRQARPDFHIGFGGGKALSYGMPSAHSQFMGFFAAYYTVMACTSTPLLRNCKVLVGLGLLTACSGVACSRWYLMYHSVEQVFAGMFFGMTVGSVYGAIVVVLRDIGLVDWVLLWRIVRLFWIKDSYYHNYKLFETEYKEVEAAKQKKCN
ncbi:hypothetical protein PUMCH_000463 [Australozyma saopauloensis]|uniref:Dolichyldiphosphatase n=1 Tax=Australozyma saopauloensis TaxID=291208 RepID=A0AAX4H4J0_9ASCO|nr:hypothetical protein PUMCH_000463 [[Candida] saopauloensis]